MRTQRRTARPVTSKARASIAVAAFFPPDGSFAALGSSALHPMIAPAFYHVAAEARSAFSRHAILAPMIDRTALRDELTATWHREIPIVAAMGPTVESYDGRSLAVRTP